MKIERTKIYLSVCSGMKEKQKEEEKKNQVKEFTMVSSLKRTFPLNVFKKEKSTLCCVYVC